MDFFRLLPARWKAAGFFLLVLSYGCSLPEVSLGGKQCPCTPGWVCDVPTNLCVSAESVIDAAELDSSLDGSLAPDHRADAGTSHDQDGGTAITRPGAADTIIRQNDAGLGVIPTPDAGPNGSTHSDAGGTVPQAPGTVPPSARICGRPLGTEQSGATMTRVSGSADDAEQEEGWWGVDVYLDSTDLEMMKDPDVTSPQPAVGVRFATVDVPPGAVIDEAYVEFQADASASERTDLQVTVEASDNASSFVNSAANLTGRERARGSVLWSNVPAWTAGKRYRTPDLSAPLQEVACRQGWRSGSAIAVLIEGTGIRSAVTYDQSPEAAPTLFVRYRF